ncbi:DUF4367 domain-containing protein [Clostridium sp. P21]|uniref:DUF4367 domain-containing protein n=1 Tax=Clostridium muellerianum TaxID=2716538 RepID=A0A7Y0HRE8_9CLOT|nr:DUF4367 domain-containing protein [Clostridium muellerianum]NMM65732.1 DUF4367 domain-containing protein [Clostridium muellerianum]
MKDNMDNFKETSNLILKDIYANDELKKLTLEKCKTQKKSRIKPIIATAASAAFLIIGFTYNYFFNNLITAHNYINSDEQKYKNPANNDKVKEALKTDDSKNLAKPTSNSSNDKNDKSETSSTGKANIASSKNSNSTNNIASNTSKTDSSISESFKNSTDVSSNKNLAQNSLVEGENNKESSNGFRGLAALHKNLDMSTAEKYFESSIITPSYVPEGFNLTDISIPDTKLKCIKLNYSSGSSYFQIYESKNLSNVEGAKVVPIKNNKAYINYSKDSKSITTTQITWIMNNIQYDLSSTLPEDVLINIAKSIN